ncbi:MAG: sulfide/dihydroorotate dehydrogenase-like FAD/NAD-binding protein [Promethearchaeota archaeon]
MAKIIRNIPLNEFIFQVDVEAPRIAKKGKAGQFVIVILHERGERVPLTLADMDPVSGIITLVVQVTGKTSLELSAMGAGEEIAHVVGPLGQPAEVEKFGTIMMVGGGCGVAPVYAQAKAFKAAGNEVISIVGFRSKDLIFWKEKMESVSEEVIVCTDDGTGGFKGYTTQALDAEIKAGRKIDRVISIGPLIMMSNTVKVTRPYGIPTIVSLNALMVDGTGMCGCCRVTTSSGVKFSCVDGPDMDGFDIDFNEIMTRNRKFKSEEEMSLELYKERCNCEQILKETEKCE